MKKTIIALAILIGTGLSSGKADTFGTGSNQFTIDFTTIGNPGNAADTVVNPENDNNQIYGSVAYKFRMGIYEISESQFYKAVNDGYYSGLYFQLENRNPSDKPATRLDWISAARFVNWLNTSKGYQAAYNLTYNGDWHASLWSSSDAWQVGGENLFRHKDSYYFLPSENEWYKAAYYDPSKNSNAGGYWRYTTASDSSPMAIPSGTSVGSTVWDQPFANGPASVFEAGGLSPYGTMGQGGNVNEWLESAWDGINSDPTGNRVFRGGYWGFESFDGSAYDQMSYARYSVNEGYLSDTIGFRVASVADVGAIPEPSTYALFALGGGLLFVAMRRRSLSRS